MQDEPMIIILCKGPDEKEAKTKIDRDISEELFACFRHLERNTYVQKEDRHKNLANEKVVTLVSFIFLGIFMQNDTILIIDVSWSPHKSQELLIGQLFDLWDQWLFDIN